MIEALYPVGVAIAVGDVGLVACCWRRRAVLAGVSGVAGIPLVAFAIASGPTGIGAEGALVIALALLVIGAGLYGIGQALERLLDKEPDEEDRDEDAHGGEIGVRRNSARGTDELLAPAAAFEHGVGDVAVGGRDARDALLKDD